MARFESTVTIDATAERVFDFLLRPRNIRRVLPPDAGLALLEAPEVLVPGSRIEFELSGLGPAQRIVHEVVELVRPQRLVEHQVQGPLKQFIHEHIVEIVEPGRITMIDLIEFKPPGGLAGFVITEQWLLDSFRTSFAHRQREMKRILESNGEVGA